MLQRGSHVGGFLLACLVTVGCTATAQQATAPSPAKTGSPEPVREFVRYEVVKEERGDAGPVVPVTFTVRNNGTIAGRPTCALTLFGRHTPVRPRPPRILPGETVSVLGLAKYASPLFNYEEDYSFFGVRCYAILPRFIESGFSDPVRGTVSVPDVNGDFLYEVGAEIYGAGLEPRFSAELRKETPAARLQAILMNLVLARGPRVTIEPAPGTELHAGDTVRLLPYTR